MPDLLTVNVDNNLLTSAFIPEVGASPCQPLTAHSWLPAETSAGAVAVREQDRGSLGHHPSTAQVAESLALVPTISAHLRY